MILRKALFLWVNLHEENPPMHEVFMEHCKYNICSSWKPVREVLGNAEKIRPKIMCGWVSGKMGVQGH